MNWYKTQKAADDIMGGKAIAKGVFYIFSVDIHNNNGTELAFFNEDTDFLLQVGKRLIARNSDVTEGLNSDNWGYFIAGDYERDDIQPDSTASGYLVFDLPPHLKGLKARLVCVNYDDTQSVGWIRLN